MSNSDIRNKKRLLWFLNPVLSISTVHQRKVVYFQLFRGRKSKYFKMLKVLIPSFSLSASISPLTQMALLAISGVFFEPPDMPLSWDSLPTSSFLTCPRFWGTFALVFTWGGAQPGTRLYVLYPCPQPPTHKGFLELQPVSPSGSCSTVNLDLGEAGWL